MKQSNLHGLLTGKWFIHQQYGLSLLPLAYNILSGKASLLNVPENSNEELVLLSKTSTSSNKQTAATFNQDSNENEYVLLIDLKNPIYKYNQSCGPRGTKHKMAIMRQFENDPNMKGVVLDVDSGGGQVAGTPEMHDFVKNYSKPVVTYTDGWMCSAAYYIGSAASHIVVNKRADAIGSIGAMISFVDMTGYYEKKGAKVITEYATKSTEKNKSFRDLLAGDPEGYIKNELDPIVEDFHTDMKAARPNLDAKVLAGGTWNAQDSINLGIADEIGTLQTAINKVFELSKSNSNKDNKNANNMSIKNISALTALLGVEALANNDNGTYLNEEQLQVINQSIVDATANVTAAQTAQQTAESELKSSQNETAEIQNQIVVALATAEVEGAENMTPEEGINALSGLITEYGKKDGDDKTQVPAGGEGEKLEKNNLIGGIDISAMMNN